LPQASDLVGAVEREGGQAFLRDVGNQHAAVEQRRFIERKRLERRVQALAYVPILSSYLFGTNVRARAVPVVLQNTCMYVCVFLYVMCVIAEYVMNVLTHHSTRLETTVGMYKCTGRSEQIHICVRA